MAWFALLAYFIVDNSITYYFYKRRSRVLRQRKEAQDELSKQMVFCAWALYVSAWIRDFVVVETIRQAQPDIVYSPSSQKLMAMQSAIVLLLTLWTKVKAIKGVPVYETFYPLYKVIESANSESVHWTPSLIHPYYSSSLLLFVTAFLFRPSSSALVAVAIYPVLVSITLWVQPRWDTLKSWVEARSRRDNKGV